MTTQTTTKWYIRDWASARPLFNGQLFDSYEESRIFISQYADETSMMKHPQDEEAREELYNGICEDLYAEEVTE